MLKKLTTNNQQLYLVLAVISYFALFFIKFEVSFDYILFLIGGLIGLSFFWWEFLFYLYTQPKLETEKKNLLSLIQQRRIREAVQFFQLHTQNHALVLRSLLFLLIYFVMAFFVITSTGSPIGVGMILGLGVRYCLDIYSFSNDQATLKRMFTQFGNFDLNNQLFSQLQKIFLILFAGISLLVLM